MSDKLDLSKFKKLLPIEVINFLDFIYSSGYLLTLVGGAVRDFALYQKLSKDLDFEVRALGNVEDENWEEEFRNLSVILGQYPSTEVELLRFNIIRVKLGSIELEISSPRIEIYDQSRESFGHSDFEVKFSNKYSYKESFKRRDFSINALGIEFGDELKLIDPFFGMKAVEKRELDYITNDFFKDPVRLLRTLRFKVAHELVLSRRLKDDLVYFNLEKLSLHYLKQEGRKIGIEKLIFEMDFARRKFALSLPEWGKCFYRIESENYPPCYELIEILLNYSIQSKATEEEIVELGRDFLIKQTIIKNICLLKSFYLFDLSEFKNKITNIDFLEVLKLEVFIKLCRLQKSHSKIPGNVLSFYLSKEVLSLLAKPVDQDSLNNDVIPALNHEQKSMLGIYCHIINN